MSPEQFKQLAGEIGNAGLLSGLFAYQLGGWDFTKDAVGKGINDKLIAIEKAYDLASSKPKDMGSAATGAIKGLANNVKDAPQYPLDNDDEKRGAIWANTALVVFPTAVAGVEGGLKALGSVVEHRLGQAEVNAGANSVMRSGATADAGSVVTSGSNGTIFSGHGSYELGSGITVVPEGTSLTVYSKFGATITDRLGNFVETGGDLSSVYSRTYAAGDRLPN